MERLAAEAGVTRVGARAWALVEAARVPVAHFEWRTWMEPPSVFAVPDRPDLAEVAGWQEGVLPETKFRHFRIDRMVMSLHPGQRAKWTTHEAIHRLVGWAWWPGMSRLELATAVRVAEALPVAAWYSFDEEGRRRCELHAWNDAWGAPACSECDAAALAGPLPHPDDAARRAEGLAFLERELVAAEASIACGRVLATPWRSVDLASDGLAWAAAHGPRLAHPSFERWVERFVPPGHGRFVSLRGLLDRVRAVAAALLEGAALAPWPCGGEAWVLQDAAQRVGEVVVDCSPACAGALDAALQAASVSGDVVALVAAYRVASARWALPDPDELFALGYPIPGVEGLGVSPQLRAGVESALPATSARLGRSLPAFIKQFTEGDTLRRQPLARRLLAFGERGLLSPPLLALARLEAALADPPAADLGALTLAPDLAADTPLRLGTVELVAVSSGWERALEGSSRTPLGRDASSHVAVRRAPDGAAEIVPLSARAAEACAAMAAAPYVPEGVSPGEWRALVAAGVWVRG